jgi:GTP-binding protein Era
MSENDILEQLRNFDNESSSTIYNRNNIDDQIENKKSITVAIIGLPNAGKSSLMNMIIGEKIAGVSSKVQTTRNAIRGIKIHNNVQIVFVDSPGVIKPNSVIDHFLSDATKRTMKEADLIIILMDIRSKNNENFQIIIDNISRYKNKEKILVINKIDLYKEEKLKEEVELIKDKFSTYFQNIFEISVTQNKGVENLLDFLQLKATQNGWMYPSDQISEAPMKFCAAEITREKLFETMSLELPYSILVDTDIYKDEPNLVTISQTIYVARQNHKSMVIGKNAQMIKNIGIQSRTELESILGKKVNLLLHVKCKENWTRNEHFIKNIIGFSGS